MKTAAELAQTLLAEGKGFYRLEDHKRITEDVRQLATAYLALESDLVERTFNDQALAQTIAIIQEKLVTSEEEKLAWKRLAAAMRKRYADKEFRIDKLDNLG
jgi:uncharacterized protein YpuA (DUF1002 family)